VVLVKTDASEESIAYIIRVTKIGEVGTTLPVTNNRCTNFVPSSPIIVTLIIEANRSSETSDLTRATRLNILKESILHIHCHENLKSYIALTG
jgi:hypothetical protein